MRVYNIINSLFLLKHKSFNLLSVLRDLNINYGQSFGTIPLLVQQFGRLLHRYRMDF